MLENLDSKQLTTMLDAAPIGVLLLDNQGRADWINACLREHLGPRSEQLLGKGVDDVAPELRDFFKPEGEVSLAADQDNDANTWLTTSVTLPEQWQVKYFVDISSLGKLLTERDRLLAQVQALSIKDEVTGLLNRRGIFQALEPQVSRSRRYNNLLSVLILKISNYSELQLQLSSTELEKLMLSLSQVLNDQMRWADTIGRLDEDEILMVLPETEADTAEQLAQKIQARLSELFIPALGQQPIHVATRTGMAQWQKGEDVGLLMRRAREMMDKGVEARIAINA